MQTSKITAMNLNIISTEGIVPGRDLEKNMQMKFKSLEKIYKRITGFEVSMKRMENLTENNCMVEGRVLISKSSFFCRIKANSFEMAIDEVIETASAATN
jgi:hypothetical protein